MIDIVKTFFSLLTSRERRNLYLIFCAVLVMAGLEVVSVASIMPFLQVAADPESVRESLYLRWIYETIGFTDTDTFLIALGIGAFIALVMSNAFIVLTTWALFRYIWGRNHSLSRRLLESYLHRPYEYFLTHNSSKLGKNILEEVKEVTNEMLMPALQGGAKAIVAVAIVGFLVFINPTVALMVTVVLGVAYVGMYYAVRDRLNQKGEQRVEANTQRYQSVSEAFGGIKEVKLRGKEDNFLDRFDDPSKRYARVQSHYQVIKRVPRYFLEAVAFGGIILIAVYLIAFQENLQQVIPILGLYAFAGYRLMPALQKAFRGLAGSRFNAAALNDLHYDLKSTRGNSKNNKVNKTFDSTEEVQVSDGIYMDNVSFTYPGASEPSVKNVSLKISANSTVGFVGQTGSGKTTTVDIIIGLLRPEKGSVCLDGVKMSGQNLREWKNSIGYVPQQIHLSDDTIARNIAFGEDDESIDMESVRSAAKRAQIFDFVEEDLPRQWDTMVGERGVKLSGGQRQRIGIARALYHRPSVLVFDEATSALDQATEARVMDAIYKLEDEHTILMIAHRISTVKRADKIFVMERGEKVNEGGYDELTKNSKEFQSIAE